MVNGGKGSLYEKVMNVKNNAVTNTKVNRYGNETKAIKTAEARYEQYLRNGAGKPSEVCLCTTVHST